MFRALLLAQWYELSDPGLEEALDDRLSLRRFCGFALDDGTPDEMTLRRLRTVLAEAGIADGIMHRGHTSRPLTAWQRWMNTALAPIRGQVERAFGTRKRSYGWRRVRYRILLRKGAHLHLLCMAMNLRRAERLLA